LLGRLRRSTWIPASLSCRASAARRVLMFVQGALRIQVFDICGGVCATLAQFANETSVVKLVLVFPNPFGCKGFVEDIGAIG